MLTFDVENLAEESFMIAWDYLERMGMIDDPDTAMVELGNIIMDLLRRGESHKIRIANIAIDIYLERHDAVAA
ncbi:hypothetical protein [Bradyrhizobium sp. LHD-71]|uniref:hypothetical protein n=1 Tax=Bradyrhizobium sp. LHD-71 TaxID=3072141 RepID=UPI0028103DB8|nr:hypothetical protein [Bradyrhizobium sp. LHD-71]MDQ8729406.1 hypothetical protein [Bradyrhizobium sp. LHD-71]